MNPLAGLLVIGKPSGMTSRRAVDLVGGLVRPAKTGHAGTLDPLASGVLVVAIGQATRLIEYVQAMPKSYMATFLLGRTSTTEDIEGKVTDLHDAPVPSRQQIEHAAAGMVGEILQRPPAYSALKVSGRRAYKLARAGQEVELAARPIYIHAIEVLDYAYPRLELRIECGSGTYVRSLGRDLAEAAGSGAVMSSLVRTAIGGFKLEHSVDPTSLARDSLQQHLLPGVLAIRGQMGEHSVNEAEIAQLRNGLSIEIGQITDRAVAALDCGGELVAVLARQADGRYRASKFLRGVGELG
ncbi:MAG TPA: tRNA pseudouridine(55) synthase TruB [Pirellulales bacterium]|jgi:tRNA pseudouridine55 synthase|nr:tRNA pseudouridine(55) synthase TruB [Pirellulales bacterium]